MKRRLLIVAVFLLAGAVVNVAVAWGCVVWVPVGFRSIRTISEDFSEDFMQLLARFPTDEPGEKLVPLDGRVNSLYSGIGVRQEIRWAWTTKDRDLQRVRFDGVVVKSVRAGLPMPSLKGDFATGRGHFRKQAVWVISRGRNRHILPFRPVWPGFAVNTLFYAGVLWLLIPGPFVLRRFIRVKRGLCTACAYPMGQSDVCSECGTPLAGRMTVAA